MSFSQENIQGFLQGGDVCQYVIRLISWTTPTSAATACGDYCLSLISDQSKKEFALFLFRTTAHPSARLQLLEYWPVVQTTTMLVGDALVFSISHGADSVDLMAQADSEDTLEDFIDDCKYALHIAKKHSQNLSSSKPRWAIYKQGDGGSAIRIDEKGPRNSKDHVVFEDAEPKSSSVDRISTLQGHLYERVRSYHETHKENLNDEIEQPVLGLDEELRDYLKLMMAEKAHEYTTLRKHRIAVVTWNVNCLAPNHESLYAHLQRNNSNDADMYAVGFQEVDMSADAVVWNDISRGKPWEDYVVNQLNLGKEPYALITSRQLAGILLVICVKESLKPYVRFRGSSLVGVGILGMLGNKGGVSISLKFFGSKVCFVNSHLAAAHDNAEGRNNDFAQILQRTQFEESVEPFGIMRHDIIVWMGDLNYRINLPDSVARDLILKKKWSSLLENDQLIAQRHVDRVFVGFDEGLIDFPPTYKFDPGTDIYDSSEKKRIPAYCDRVLWFHRSPLTLLKYTCLNILMSDHRPVLATFDANIQIVDQAKRMEIMSLITRDVDQAENDMIPDAVISCNSFFFKDIKYNVPCEQTFVVQNVGSVISRFRLIPKNHDKAPTKPWVRVDPTMGTLLPGQSTQVTITILVDSKSATLLNRGLDTLDDILVISIIHGKHHFINIAGSYLRSSHGLSMEELVCIPQPIRSTACESMEDTMLSHPALQVPKELWLLLDCLNKYHLQTEGLFVTNGILSEIEQIRDFIDTATPIPPSFSAHSVAEVLIHWLEALPDSVVPPGFYQRAIDFSTDFEKLKIALSGMPNIGRKVFLYIISFLKKVLKHSGSNNLTEEQLALIFGSVLIRTPFIPKQPKSGDVVTNKKMAVILYFLRSP